MTGRHFPPEPVFEAESERRVFELLKRQLPDDAVVFCNLRFSDRRMDREADVVVAWPQVGLAVLEVKGGVVGCTQGKWTQSLPGGAVKRIDPVEQAMKCKYLLRDFLAEHPRWVHGRPRLAHLVVLPATHVPADFRAPACPRWMVLGREDLDDMAGRIWDALRDIQHQPAAPTAEQVEDLVDCLAGRLLPQRDLIGEAAERERHVDLLTERQAKVLDVIRCVPRVEVRGGAGSGKTWLAVEQARRLANDGKLVALMCYSRGLARFLHHRVGLLNLDERPAYVGTFRGLGVAWGAPQGSDDDSDYWERRLPEAMVDLAHARGAGERFDAIVVDEGQDFADSWWPAVLAALRDPARDGLSVLADEGQRVFARHGRPPVDLVPITLDENLRNTKQIAQTFGSLAAGQMRYRGGEGVPVRFVPCAIQDAVGAADDEVDRLLAEGWKHEHVALFTTYRRHPVQVERQQHGQDAYWDSFWADDDVFFGHVLGFKGLERPAVVLAVNGFRDEGRAREMLYVGLSRARDLLVVCGDLLLIRPLGGEAVARRLVGP